MKARNWTIMATALVGLFITGSALSQGFGPPGMYGGGHPGGMMPGGGGGMGQHFSPENLGAFRMLAGHLDLTDEQVDEIQTILTDTREDMQALMEDADPPEERIRFVELFASPTLTVSDLEENLGRDDDLMEAGRDIIFQAIVDLHDVLTAEQLEQLAELVEEYAGAAPGGMGHGMMGGRGMGSSPQGRGPGHMPGM